MGRGSLNHASGLLLAAPGRAAKSTFMPDDLIPALIQRDVVTTYVDLWADRQRDPACLLSDALAITLRTSQSPPSKPSAGPASPNSASPAP